MARHGDRPRQRGGGFPVSFAATKLCRAVRLPPTQKAVLMCLADYCHDDGKDWHSIAAMQEWTCLGRTAVIDALKGLELAGLIRIERAFGQKSTTFLQLDRLAALAPSGLGNPEQPADNEPAALTSDTPDQSATRTGTPRGPVRLADDTSPAGGPHPSATRTGPVRQADTKHHKHQEEPVKHQSPRKRARKVSEPLADVDLPSWLPRDAWQAYVEHRDHKGNPMTALAQKLAIKQLTAWKALGHDPRSVLEASVMNGWVGIFEPKPNGTSAHKGLSKPDAIAMQNAEVGRRFMERVDRRSGAFASKDYAAGDIPDAVR